MHIDAETFIKDNVQSGAPCQRGEKGGGGGQGALQGGIIRGNPLPSEDEERRPVKEPPPVERDPLPGRRQQSIYCNNQSIVSGAVGVYLLIPRAPQPPPQLLGIMISYSDAILQRYRLITRGNTQMLLTLLSGEQ